MTTSAKGALIPEYLVYLFAIASVGGPLALVSLNFFNSSYLAGPNALYATLGGAALFIAPLAVWYRYSKTSSSGGLYAFVEKAAGKRVADAQGWLWIISYFLYLPWTVAYITYNLLPSIIGNSAYLSVMEIALPILISCGILISFKRTIQFIALTAIIQIVAIAVIVAAMFSIGAGSASTAANSPTLFTGILATSLLFVCSSLVLFLGGEVRGGAKTIRKALLISFAAVAALFILGTLALGSASPSQAGSEIPALLVLGGHFGSGAGIAAALLVILSLTALIVIEFIALTRLSRYMFNLEVGKGAKIIAVLFIISSVVVIPFHNSFTNIVPIASLGALYLALAIPFIVYPLFSKKNGGIKTTDILVSAVSSLIMLYGFYTIIVPLL